jgi:hypothetical protein
MYYKCRKTGKSAENGLALLRENGLVAQDGKVFDKAAFSEAVSQITSELPIRSNAPLFSVSEDGGVVVNTSLAERVDNVMQGSLPEQRPGPETITTPGLPDISVPADFKSNCD